MKKRLVNVDYSNYNLSITDIEEHNIKIYTLTDNKGKEITFMNTSDSMIVTGKYGRYIFCRPFDPSEFHEPDYMDEKLEISTLQKAKIYNEDETLKAIIKIKKDFENLYGRKMNDDELEFYNELQANVSYQDKYNSIVLNNKPLSIDYDDVPYIKTRLHSLNLVYDAFYEIYLRLSNNIRKDVSIFVQVLNTDKPIPAHLSDDFKEWMYNKGKEFGVGRHITYYAYNENFQDDIKVELLVKIEEKK